MCETRRRRRRREERERYNTTSNFPPSTEDPSNTIKDCLCTQNLKKNFIFLFKTNLFKHFGSGSRSALPNKTMKNRAALRVLKRFVRMTITKRGDGNRWRINEKPRISQANHDGGETKRTTKEGADKSGTAFLSFASFSHTGAKRIKEFMDSSTSTPTQTATHKQAPDNFAEIRRKEPTATSPITISPGYIFSFFDRAFFRETKKKEKHVFVCFCFLFFFFFFQFLTFSQTFLSFFFSCFFSRKSLTRTQRHCAELLTQCKHHKQKQKKEKRKQKKEKKKKAKKGNK